MLYIAVLAASGAFYVFHAGYFSWILFLAVAGFLPLELLLTLPVWLKTRVELTPSVAEVEAGIPFYVRVRTSSPLPVFAVRARLYCENLFAGTICHTRVRTRPGRDDAPKIPHTEVHCGAVCCSLSRPYMLDAAGILALPLPKVHAQMVMVRPPQQAAPPALPDTAARQISQPRPPSQHSAPAATREYTDIREFREGDSLREVHWKLSSKLDKLIVRESTYPPTSVLHLAVDCFGEPCDVCAALARLSACCEMLCAAEQPHYVETYAPNGRLLQKYVEIITDFEELLWEILGTPLPKTGPGFAAQPPAGSGTLLLVGPQALQLFEDGRLKEVLA